MKDTLTLRIESYSRLLPNVFVAHIVGHEDRWQHVSAREGWMWNKRIRTGMIAKEYSSPFMERDWSAI